MYFKNRKLKLTTALLFFSLFLTPKAFAGGIEIEEAIAFAGFIQDLVGTSSLSSGAICASGNDEVSKLISREKGFVNLDDNPSKFTSCKAIYIATSKQKGFAADILKFSKGKILTIAIFDGFTEAGGMVQVQMGRRNFELTLNPKAMKDSGVRLSALAMSLVIN